MSGHYEERIDPNSPVDKLTGFPTGTIKVWVEDPAAPVENTAANTAQPSVAAASVSNTSVPPPANPVPTTPTQNFVNMQTPQGTIVSVDTNSDAYKQNLGGQFTGYKLANVTAPASDEATAAALAAQNANSKTAMDQTGAGGVNVNVEPFKTTTSDIAPKTTLKTDNVVENKTVDNAANAEVNGAMTKDSLPSADQIQFSNPNLTTVQKDEIKNLVANKPLSSWTTDDFNNFHSATGLDARNYLSGGGTAGAKSGANVVGTQVDLGSYTPEALNYAKSKGQDWNTMTDQQKQEAQNNANLKTRVDTTDNNLIANKDFISGAFKSYANRDATASELLQYAGKTVDQVKSAAKKAGGVSDDFAGASFGENNVPNLNAEQKNTFLNNMASGANSISSDDYTKFLKDMSNGYVTPEEYMNYLKTGGQISYSEFSKKLTESGITQLEKDLYSLPDKNYETLYKTKYDELNLGQYKTKIRDLEIERDKKISQMSTNPFLTAAGRNGEALAIKSQYDSEIAGVQSKYDDGLAEVESYMTRNEKYDTLKREVYGAKLTYLKSKVEEEISLEQTDRTKDLMAKMLPDFYANNKKKTTADAEAAIKKDLLKTGEYYIAPDMTNEKAMEMINSGNYLVSKIGDEYLVKPTSTLTGTTDYKNWVLMGKPGTFEDYMKSSASVKQPTEYQTRYAVFGKQAESANADYTNLVGDNYIPSQKDQALINQVVQQMDNNIPLIGPLIEQAARNGLSEKGRQFLTTMQTFSNAMARIETGAAVKNGEWQMYYNKYFPTSADSVDAALSKKAKREEDMNNYKNASGGAYTKLFGGTDTTSSPSDSYSNDMFNYNTNN